MVKTSEESEGGEEARAYAAVFGRNGLMKIVRKPGRLKKKLFRFMKRKPSRELISGSSYQTVGGYCCRQAGGGDMVCQKMRETGQ